MKDTIRKFRYNKIVRDRVQEIIAERGGSIVFHELNEKEKIEALKKKVCEEADEILSSSTKEELIEEIADLFEIVATLCKTVSISHDDIEKKQENKRINRGGFDRCLFIDYVCLNPNDPTIAYCLAHPDKYPEIFE